MKTLFLSSSLIMLVLLSSCRNSPANQEAALTLQTYFKTDETGIKNGGVKQIIINTPKGPFKVWTKRIGNNPKIKLLLLSGGPGISHEYFECFESFLPAEGIEIIYYDQLGCGNSDNPNDTSMWSLPRYVEELEQVRLALNLDKNNFFLLGHSWGGILAMEYALKYQQNLKGLIISNMMASAPEYGKYANNVLAKQFDPKILAEIREIEAKKDFDNPNYMKLLFPNFYCKHILRLPADSWPEPVNRAMSKLNQSLYVTMQGPSEFGVSGKLEKWDVTNLLKSLTIPTLVIGAKNDTMDPQHMKWIASEVQNGNFLYCSSGSHMCMWDDQEIYMKGLINFLKKVNNQ